MKITATFDSYEEFIAFASGAGEKALIGVATGGTQTPQEALIKSKAKNSTPKKHEEEEQARAEPKTEAAPKVDESFRVKVRKTLATLNKKTGKNTASELIHTFGVDKLTKVAEEDLPALMEKAEEALNA